MVALGMSLAKGLFTVEPSVVLMPASNPLVTVERYCFEIALKSFAMGRWRPWLPT